MVIGLEDQYRGNSNNNKTHISIVEMHVEMVDMHIL